MTTAVRLRIEGFVQGVGYRAWAHRTAIELSLSGWVRNRADGSVEAFLSGEDSRIRAFVERARRGPRSARVSKIVETPVTETASGFKILPTA